MLARAVTAGQKSCPKDSESDPFLFLIFFRGALSLGKEPEPDDSGAIRCPPAGSSVGRKNSFSASVLPEAGEIRDHIPPLFLLAEAGERHLYSGSPGARLLEERG